MTVSQVGLASFREAHHIIDSNGLSRLPAGLSQTASVRRSSESGVEKA